MDDRRGGAGGDRGPDGRPVAGTDSAPLRLAYGQAFRPSAPAAAHRPAQHILWTGAAGLLSAIQAQTPDAVLLAGDMADDSRGDAGVDALMSALGGAYPCCYVSGNHEVRTGCLEALKRRFRSWGITVLEGSGTLLATPGGTLRICGVDDPPPLPASRGGWSSSGPARR